MTIELREPGWDERARARLERVIAEHAPSAGERRVAVFDWDNTSMRGDVGDLALAWMLAHDAVLQPAARDWSRLGALTPAGSAALCGACDALAEPGSPLPTSSHEACARAIAHVAFTGRTPEGEEAFERRLYPTLKSTYAFMAQLLAGHTHAEARSFARAALDAATAAPIGARAEVGGVPVEIYARVNPQIVEVMRALERAGYEVWIVSASAQPFVEEAASRVGIEPARVIGARLARASGALSSGWEPLGEGDGDEPITTFHEGKRAWINRVIFGAPASEARRRRSDPRERPVLAFGDSDTDLAMLEDATALAFVFDRHQVRVSCAALADPERWLVHPLFVEPAPPRAEPYPCASYTDELGPIRSARETTP